MKKNLREYPLFSACGLNCGLCPNHYTNGVSKCSGCGSDAFFNPACAIIACNQQHNLQYCFLCHEYPCKRYANIDAYDSFITHRNQIKDNAKAQKIGIEAYINELQEKIGILQFLLENYNDGRRKSFFCLAINLLELDDVKIVMQQVRIIDQTLLLKEKASLAAHLFQAAADEKGLLLKLRKKQKNKS